MNQLAVDIIELLAKYGVTENQDMVLNKIAENVDRAQLCCDIERCSSCALYKSTSHKVPGEGPRGASLMIVGEYSGEMENATGRPFVGPAGQLLDKLLFEACIDRTQIYLTNAVKCHTPYSRKPEVEELSACASQFLSKELEIIKPKHIIAMGAIAASLFTSEPFVKVRGTTIESRGYRVTFSFHPKDIMRKKDEEYTNAYNFVIEDMCRAVTDLMEIDNDASVCRKMTPEEEKIFNLENENK